MSSRLMGEKPRIFLASRRTWTAAGGGAPSGGGAGGVGRVRGFTSGGRRS